MNLYLKQRSLLKVCSDYVVQLRLNSYFWMFLAACIYYGLAVFGMNVFALKPSNITLLWMPSGIALVMCLHWGSRVLPFIVVASFAANYAGMASVNGYSHFIHTAISALCDGMVGLIALHFFRKYLPNGLARAHDLLTFGFWVCVVPTTVTSIILSVNLAVGGYIQWSELSAFMLMLILADSLGMLLVYQIYQGWYDGIKLAPSEWYWLGVGVFCMLIVFGMGFSTLPGMVYFTVPILLVLSFNLKLIRVASISTLSFVVIIAATAQGVGPFVATDSVDADFRLMAFVFSSVLTILGIALQNRELISVEHSNRLWKEAAEHDHLTGLMNRRAFMPRIQSEHQRAIRSGSAYTFAMLDLDHFKLINDTYGHHYGDLVLREFTKVIMENCRSIDLAVRMGGEEFGILFPSCSIPEAEVPLERIRSKLEAVLLMAGGQAISVTVSIGVTAFSAKNESELQVIARADDALYLAKSKGRNRVVVANAGA